MGFSLCFDIGHSSIGWGVLSSSNFGANPVIKGCGSVIFPADDCLASKRRQHRRTRRNIRATRQRIGRLKKLFLYLGVLSEGELNANMHAAPHVLAARVLVKKEALLTWNELWSVLRWYAHNRGYDGNSRWARHEVDADETEKELVALELMEKHGTGGKSMAETICASLGIDLSSEKISSAKPFKTLNAAFPRKLVRKEVLDILYLHKGILPKLDDGVIQTLVAPEGPDGCRAWETVSVPGIKLPRRYYGGLLFGQLIPRFDNRIIARCPITGGKVPNKASLDFLNYRWAMILANLRIDGQPLSAGQRQSLHAVMQEKGRLTTTELRKELEAFAGVENTNVKSYFELHPDSAEALVLDPALALYNGEGAGSSRLRPYWECLPELVRLRALGRWKKRRIVNLQWMLGQVEDDAAATTALRKVIDSAFAADQKKKKSRFLTLEHFLNQSFAPSGLSGRAPYSRSVMRDVCEFVLSTNRHPAEAATDELYAGPLYRSKEVLSSERSTSLAKLTNNHLIRQRLDILLRLVDDILAEYANGDASKVTDVVVEVASDLQTYSGLSAKEMQGELSKRLSHFKSAVTKLEKDAPDLPITGSLIRKCRIAMDLGWTCPFTGKGYDVHNLSEMEREHIIPYADRQTNALDALVLTFPWVNRLKGKRTAMAFINDVAEDQRFLSPKKYIEKVNKLKIASRHTHPEDARRQASRQRLMLLERYESKDHGFTPGALSQTSHLNRLSARQLETRFVDPETHEPTVRIHSIPGQVTAETRKSWRMLGTLAQACPEILDESGKPRNKTEIRGITHLHHALDAVVLGLTHCYLPGVVPRQAVNQKGAIWAAMLKRNKSESDQELLMQTGMFVRHSRNSSEPKHRELDVCLCDIPKEVKEQVAQRLAEKRVVQHIPSDQSDYHLEETTWRYLCDFDGQALLLQKVSRDSLRERSEAEPFGWQDIILKDGAQKKLDKMLKDVGVLRALRQNRININLIRRGLVKFSLEPHRSLVGFEAGKLKSLKAVRIIDHNANYGMALTPKPQIIPFHDVRGQLNKLASSNGGCAPVVIRNGSIIRIEGVVGREGLWRVVSCQASLKLDLTPVALVSDRKVNWREVSIQTLIKKRALTVMKQSYIGPLGC